MTTNAPKPILVEPGIYRVISRGQTRYKVRVRLEGRDGVGQKFANATKNSLKEARDFKTDALKARRDGDTKVLSNKTTFRELCEIWERAQTCRPTTLVAYKTHTRRACAHRFGRKTMGEMAVSTIQRHHIEELVRAYEADGCSIVTCQYMLARLRSVFNVADDMGLIVRNPATRVKGRGVPKKVRTAADGSTIALVKEALRTHVETADDFGLWLLTLAGLRRGEVLGLKWTDIDFKSATVTVSRSRVAHWVDGVQTFQVGKPKTKNGERILHIAEMPEMVTALKAMRALQMDRWGVGQAKDGWLALDSAGEPLLPERWSCRWDKAVKAAGVAEFTLHEARHTSVTAMRDAGVPDHVIAQWHGHSEAIMKDTYSHALDAGLVKAGAALAKALGA